MKRLLFTSILSLITLVIFAQADSTKNNAKDTAVKPEVAVNYAIVLNEQEYAALINLVKIADEKPSVINAWISFINSRTQQLQLPNTAEPKKENKK